MSLRIREGRLGRAWLAIREDELAARMMGVPLMRTKLAAYAVGAFVGGIGGVAFATHVGSVYASRVRLRDLDHPAGDGGARRNGQRLGRHGRGARPGLDQLDRAGAGSATRSNGHSGTSVNFSSYQFLVFGLILVLMMLFRREGLLPETRTKQVLAEPERGELESVGADLEGGAA